MLEISDFSKTVIRSMYEKCIDAIGTKSGSLIEFSLTATKNSLFKILMNGKCPIEYKIAVEELENAGYIRETTADSYVLTAKGAWYVEYDLLAKSFDKLIEVLDQKKFDAPITKINDRNKIILFSLLGARCFSKDCVATYSNTDESESPLYELLKESHKILCKYGVIENKSFNSYTQAKSKNEIASIFGSSDKLTSGTNGIFSYTSKGREYYLNVVSNGNICKTRISSILKLIFDDKITINNVNEIANDLDEMAFNYSSYFATGSNNFNSSEYSLDIKESVELTIGL